MIEKKLVQIGGSWGIVIPKLILDALDINAATDKVELYLKDDEVRIRKIQK